MNKPLVGDGNPKRLPILAVKVSTGKAVEKGIRHYLISPWKDGWEGWLKHAKDEFPSVLEHITLTFHIDGCSRVCSHQLVRHRLASFTQESQRYTEARILKALKTKNLEEAHHTADRFAAVAFLESVKNATSIDDEKYRYMLEEVTGEKDAEEMMKACNELAVIPPKVPNKAGFCEMLFVNVMNYIEMRRDGVPMEDARYVLPQAMRTSLLVTANLREWLHIIELRAHPKAQWEIREVAEKIRDLILERLKIDF